MSLVKFWIRMYNVFLVFFNLFCFFWFYVYMYGYDVKFDICIIKVIGNFDYFVGNSFNYVIVDGVV